MTRLQDKVALVTGGATGLGRAIATRLAAEGARVVITDIDAAIGGDVQAATDLTFLHHDVCDEDRWTAVVAEVEQRFGALHILVNNAGIVGSPQSMNLEQVDMAAWRQVFAVNLDGVLLGCKLGLAAMRRAGQGSIVNISSIAGQTATPYALAYGASKAAVTQLTKSVAQYCAEQSLAIRCNSVHPGNVHTRIWDEASVDRSKKRGLSPETILNEVRARMPLGDFVQPSDVAALVAFLASDDARNITGSQMVVDGGMTTCDTFHLSERFKRAICGTG